MHLTGLSTTKVRPDAAAAAPADGPASATAATAALAAAPAGIAGDAASAAKSFWTRRLFRSGRKRGSAQNGLHKSARRGRALYYWSRHLRHCSLHYFPGSLASINRGRASGPVDVAPVGEFLVVAISSGRLRISLQQHVACRDCVSPARSAPRCHRSVTAAVDNSSKEEGASMLLPLFRVVSIRRCIRRQLEETGRLSG